MRQILPSFGSWLNLPSRDISHVYKEENLLILWLFCSEFLCMAVTSMIIMSFPGQLCSLVGNSHQNSMRICGINIPSVFLCGQVVLNIPVMSRSWLVQYCCLDGLCIRTFGIWFGPQTCNGYWWRGWLTHTLSKYLQYATDFKKCGELWGVLWTCPSDSSCSSHMWWILNELYEIQHFT